MNSKAFDEYNYWLGQIEDSNWNEYITEQVAKGVLGEFSAEDWNRLNDTILSSEEYWQERSAAALGENRSTQAIEILKKLLDSPFTEVLIVSASELDWSEVPIENKYAKKIQAIINSLNHEELESYPELENLLKKSSSAQL
ncbi:HEAT repeat domain-containing protein [Pseudomonas glycinae]|uniref:HEAT repeat domain-containing protein n=1 Tax=Pseudomonas glycinae TaxID=1785145 RepID=UPI001F45C657|nr:HEAT repeat domain-containing protein [Pseudomonas glycinae]